MKIGDKVKVTDGSYALSIICNKLEHTSGNALIAMGQHTTVAVECDLPADDRKGNERNDTIIRSPSGTVTFIQERFLVSTIKCCPECGKAL